MNLIQVKEELCDCIPAMEEVCESALGQKQTLADVRAMSALLWSQMD
jgi:hypothetical protein